MTERRDTKKGLLDQSVLGLEHQEGYASNNYFEGVML
jgi:hypothetical protein